MQLHENHSLKGAGVAGLRARQLGLKRNKFFFVPTGIFTTQVY